MKKTNQIKTPPKMKKLVTQTLIIGTCIYLSTAIAYGQLQDVNKSDVQNMISNTVIGKILSWIGRIIAIISVFYALYQSFHFVKKINAKKQQGEDDEDQSSVIKDFLIKVVLTLVVGFGAMSLINYFMNTV